MPDPKFLQINSLILNLVGDNRPYAEVSIKSHKILGLLDSGANLTVLGKNAHRFINNLNLTIHPIKTSILTADGKPHSANSFVVLPITYNKQTYNIQTLIIPSLTKELILGMDFWSAFEITPIIRNEISVLESEKRPLTPEETFTLNQVIQQFPTTCNGKPLGSTTVLKHVIDTGTAVPIKQRGYPISPYVQREMDEELSRMISLGVIEPSIGPWSNPMVGVRKSNGKLRLCLDARKLNSVTIPDSYALPYITRILGQISGTKYLSKIDLKDAFWQIPLEEKSKQKTAFTVPNRGLYQFKVMPFGLSNAAQSQCRLMDQVLGFDLEPSVFCYLDDVIIATNSFQEHIKMLSAVAERLKRANLTISVEKSQFCLKEMKYLGYVLGESGIRTDPEKVSAILLCTAPSTVKEVRRFLGMVGWYRRFISNFAQIVAPISDLLKKNARAIKWTSEAEEAFNTLKIALTSAPILSMPDFSKPFQVQSDSSEKAVGAVLIQHYDDREHVIAYMSQKLSPTQQKYSVTEKECLSLILAVEKWRCYLEGSHFIAITDHASLQWLHNLKDPAGRLARWALRLQPYRYTLLHRKGVLNVVPDFLSRCISSLDLEVESFSGDVVYEKLKNKITSEPNKHPNYQLNNDKIYKNVGNNRNREWKLFVPIHLREKILIDSHDSLLSAHQGFSKTLQRIKQLYYWPKLWCDVRRYVSNCDCCKQCKPVNYTLKTTMGDPKLPNKPWRLIAVDLMGPFPRSQNQNIFLLVVLDVFTKFTLLKPLRSSSTKLICEYLKNNVFLLFGVPETVVTDNGPQFRSHLWTDFLEKYNISSYKNAIYHAQNNPVERYNRGIGSAIRAYIGDSHTTWDKNIHEIGCAIRTAVNDSTKFTPFYLNFGYNMNTSGVTYKTVDILDSMNESPVFSLEENRSKTLDNLISAYERYSRPYNLRAREISFKVGDEVWRRQFCQSDAEKKFCKKFALLYLKGVVKEKLGKNCYRIVNEKGKDVGVYNAKDLQTVQSI